MSGREGGPTDGTHRIRGYDAAADAPEIRKPGDLPATDTLTGRGVPVTGPALCFSRHPPLSPNDGTKTLTIQDDTLAHPGEAAPACDTPAELLVCATCRRREQVTADGERPGARLAENLEAAGMPWGVTLRRVDCLQNCDHGCSLAFRGGPHRWTYVYGNFHEDDDVALILEGAALYRDTANGLIPWRQRPVHFRKNCIARIPPLEASE